MKKTKVILTIVLFVLLSTMLFSCKSSVFPDHRGEEGYIDEETYVHAGVAYREYEDHYEVIEVDPTYTSVEIMPEIEGTPVTAIRNIYTPLFLAYLDEETIGMLCSIIIPPTIKAISDGAFSECVKLVEVCNLSSLNIEIGSEYYGCAGYYAKEIYTSRNYVSKIRKDENGFLLYENDTEVILLGYKGPDKDIVIPDNVTEIRGIIALGIDSLDITIDIKRETPFLTESEDIDKDFFEDGIIMTVFSNIIDSLESRRLFNKDEDSIDEDVVPFSIYVDTLETIKTYFKVGMEYCIYGKLYIDSNIVIPEDFKSCTETIEKDGVVVDEHIVEYVEYGTIEYNGKTYTRYVLKEDGELQELPEDALQKSAEYEQTIEE